MVKLINELKKKGGVSYNKGISDLDNLENLKDVAMAYNLDTKEKKSSLFRRGIDIISRPLYASAGAAKAVVTGENVLQEAYKGITSQEKETYSDVLKSAGVENKYLRGVVGFALDIALDPSTYFGGSLIRGTGKVLGKGL